VSSSRCRSGRSLLLRALLPPESVQGLIEVLDAGQVVLSECQTGGGHRIPCQELIPLPVYTDNAREVVACRNHTLVIGTPP